ncbi:hypothetical protein LRS13_13540 [Svornostia abyssi]|uniref:Uncharacterized protein n=1 Tax=Svornostia abyssi TaxID=2898438 RepID=A0ABY5PAZ1_9ACTN|nr:hypothetical protein LRS13_13540 [Parviterribacteraceae bacterium J379]
MPLSIGTWAKLLKAARTPLALRGIGATRINEITEMADDVRWSVRVAAAEACDAHRREISRFAGARCR